MELKYYWRLVMTNGQEFVIKSDIEQREDFLKTLNSRGLFAAGSSYITLQLGDTADPMDINKDTLFSVQKAREGVIGNQTKLWRLL